MSEENTAKDWGRLGDIDGLEKMAALENPLASEGLLVQRMQWWMRDKLAENSHKKTSFLGLGLQFLSARLTQEKRELVRAVQSSATVEEVWREAADVANFAAMIALKYELERASDKMDNPK